MKEAGYGPRITPAQIVSLMPNVHGINEILAATQEVVPAQPAGSKMPRRKLTVRRRADHHGPLARWHPPGANRRRPRRRAQEPSSPTSNVIDFSSRATPGGAARARAGRRAQPGAGQADPTHGGLSRRAAAGAGGASRPGAPRSQRDLVRTLRQRRVYAGVDASNRSAQKAGYLHPLWQHETGPGHGGAATG